MTPRNHHVVIVGGGMAGLMAAKELLLLKNDDNNNDCQNLRVTIVESSDRLGGRIRAGVANGNSNDTVMDIGAEFIHGKGTLLTSLVQELFGSSIEMEELFVTAHADGGPSECPTKDGMYGMYYVGNKLVRYDDECIRPLSKALGQMEDYSDNCSSSSSSSVGQVLRTFGLSSELMALADASYGNTVGASHDNVSLSVLTSFEKYWQEHEEEGDLRLPCTIGMYGVVKRLTEELQKDHCLAVLLNNKVTRVSQNDAKIRLYMSKGDGDGYLEADAVIITVPPPALTAMDIILSPEKENAIKYIGMNKAVKVLLLFHNPIWPCNVQSVICGDCPIPEIWFKKSGNFHIATGYLTSPKANDFLIACSSNQEEAASIMLAQLIQIFSIPAAEQCQYVSSYMHVWEHGYMYPKVNMTMNHLSAMAMPMGRIFFAGEATNTNACCTVQAAMETGVRAAKEVKATLFTNS